MNTVLIVDDSLFLRMLIRNAMTKYGFEVVGEASSGKDGIKLYKELKPDLVTMDITMNDMNGLDALKCIMQHDPGAKVLMISSMGQEVYVMDAIRAGAKGFIVKPFDEEQLGETLKKM